LRWLWGLLLLAGPSCRKVPLYDIYAYFGLADATWFAEEQTLFLFYEVHAEQGLGELSQIEVSYVTDDAEVPWTPLHELVPVHTHLPVDCGINSRCGSMSVHVPIPPRNVQLRLRYHRDGALALGSETLYNAVEAGPPYSHRSFLVYGVFDETNQRVQWRGRHQFPTLRNEKVQELGLRRDFTVRDQRFGTAELATGRNPYGYGVTCPDDFVSTGFPELSTNERARFEPQDLPLGASDASTVCTEATVFDATGTFTAGAIARKNPEVRPAFPVLRSPVHDATPLRFFLAPCDRTISEDHEEMQRQRLQLEGVPTTCTDDWQLPWFVDDLVIQLRDAVEAERPAGHDMVLVIGLHQDEPGLPEVVQEALAQVVPDERLRASPRLAGAFVLDSTDQPMEVDELDATTLWCPACTPSPDEPDLVLGPFTFGSIPILPDREDYLEFIDTYSKAQAGSVQTLTFRTPEFSTISDHVAVGDSGAATFLNNEHISADADDAFSYCVGDEQALFLFRSDAMQDVDFAEAMEEYCDALALPEEVCAAGELGLAPLEWLPDWHNVFRETNYDLGMFWDFPFLVRMEYETVAAGAVSAFGLSVPFGISSPAEEFLGTAIWTQDEFSLAKALTQCSRFCEHPTFDSAGVYHVTDVFRDTYAHNCYLPRYPKLGDNGFPLDP
jgi:hypothetical protein